MAGAVVVVEDVRDVDVAAAGGVACGVELAVGARQVDCCYCLGGCRGLCCGCDGGECDVGCWRVGRGGPLGAGELEGGREDGVVALHERELVEAIYDVDGHFDVPVVCAGGGKPIWYCVSV